ncbi:hypothetical protein OHB35_50395 [Streptomyces phaeochromogenes]|uniref:Uncharacterized protein n=1 Tax=Streptomyces phaeochromogenes TaxID=1923 RepID=A0ABZ1HRE1_STRPH|nr:hypothetical protein [Streptomyces phaeochromogenes]WSD20810.1 hypothetical protein OHB35_50395 [Streptomyces phaeochromogenes]
MLVVFGVQGNTPEDTFDEQGVTIRDVTGGEPGWLMLGSGGVLFGSIGPCSELVVDVDVLDYTGHWNGVLKKHKLSREELRYRNPLMSFTDSSGVSWLRSESDLMKVQDGNDEVDLAYFGMQDAEFIAPRVPPVAQQVPSCGAPGA